MPPVFLAQGGHISRGTLTYLVLQLGDLGEYSHWNRLEGLDFTLGDGVLVAVFVVLIV